MNCDTINHTSADDAAAMRAAIRSTYDAAPADVRADGLAWYRDAAAMIRADAAEYGLPFETAVAIYASCSINAAWRANVTTARKWLAYAAGRGTYPGGLPQVRARCEAAIAERPETFADAWRIALQGGDDRGSKVGSFCANFTGRTEHVTIDRWAMVAAGVAVVVPHGHGGGKVTPCAHGKAPKGPRYARIRDAYQTVAAELGISPAELQAVAWVAVRGSAV